MTTPTNPNLPAISDKKKQVDRPSLTVLKKAYEDSHAKIWLSWSVRDVLLYGKKHIPEIQYAGILAAYRSAIANFVYHVTGKSIPVNFSSGQQNYSNGNSVVLSFTSDPRVIDCQVGTAMHEAWHCAATKKTDHPESVPGFEWMNFLSEQDTIGTRFKDMLLGNVNRTYPTLFMKIVKEKYPTLWTNIDKYVESRSNGTLATKFRDQQIDELIRGYFHLVWNILEDRRIDTLGFLAAPGYQPYYEAMYKTLWHNDTVSILLQHPMSRIPTLDMYFLHLVNLTNRHATPDALPGLRDIWKLVNLKNILRFGSTDKKWNNIKKLNVQKLDISVLVLPDILDTCFKILDVMFQHAKYVPWNEMQKQCSSDLKLDGSGSDKQKQKKPKGAEDLANLDGGLPQTIEMDAGEFEQFMQNLKEKVGGRDTKDEVGDANLMIKVNSIQKGDTKIKNCDPNTNASMTRKNGLLVNTVPVVVHYGLTEMYKNDSGFMFMSSVPENGMREAIVNGIRMGNLLAHKLRIFADSTTIKYPNQKRGELDSRRVFAGGFGSTDMFMRKFTETKGKIHLHMTIDCSGSMSGRKWINSMTIGIAMAQVASKLRDRLHFVLSVRSSSELPEIAIVFDSKKHTMQYLRKYFPYLHVCGATPEGLTFSSILEEIQEVDDKSFTQKYFVNISDGCPEYSYQNVHYGGDLAASHTAGIISKIRHAGVQVLSYFVHDGYEYDEVRADFIRMYGRDAVFCDVKSLMDIARTLNRKFMQNINL
jgi:hypothetical protein